MDTVAKIQLRLGKLREYVKLLKSFKGITEEELVRDLAKRGTIERYLQLAIEACMDIAELIISDQRFPTPENGNEAIEILGREKVIDEQFAKDFSHSVGFRNILVHDYIDIDYKEVADKINNRLDDFDRFAQKVAKFLESK